jgi:hypothetical protein
LNWAGYLGVVVVVEVPVAVVVVEEAADKRIGVGVAGDRMATECSMLVAAVEVVSLEVLPWWVGA